MQTLTQPQANRLKDLLEYAKIKVHHPEWQPPPSAEYYTRFHTLGLATAQNVRENAKIALEAAERRAQGIEQYESFIKDIDEFLMIIRTLDYSTALDGAIVEGTDKSNSATLGDILEKPEAFDHLGKRVGHAEPILTESYPSQSS